MTTTKGSATVMIAAAPHDVFSYVLAHHGPWETPAKTPPPGDIRDQLTLPLPHIVLGVSPVHMEGYTGGRESDKDHEIVMRAMTGPIARFTFEPVDGGTQMTVALEETTRVPLMDKVLILIGTHGKGLQHDLAETAAFIKKHFEG